MLVRSSQLIMLLLFSFCTVYKTVGQATCIPAFIKEYSGDGQVQPQSITSLDDGSIIITGNGTANASSSTDGLVMKLSNTGGIIWSYLIGGSGEDAFTGAIALKDGSLLLYGTTTSFGYTGGKAWLVRISTTGSLIWSKQTGMSNAGTDRMKTAAILADGDIICTYNSEDSSVNSNAVVFRIAPDGTFKWTHTFDNGNNDSFTSLAVSGDTLYAGGFCTTTTTKYGVIVQINTNDGALISSQTLRKDGDAYQNEVTGLQVYGGIISYGLWLIENGGQNNGIALVQTDMLDNTLYKRYGDDFGDTSYMMTRRTTDNGFLILRTDNQSSGASTLIKINNFASSAWGNVLGTLSWQKQVNYALDLTPDGGCISAGYHGDTRNLNIMNVMKMAANGETATCRPATVGMHFDTLSNITYTPLSWRLDLVSAPLIDETIVPVVSTSTKTENDLCDTLFCTDKTPLPEGCGKTYRIEYAADQSTILRDAATTDEGEKLAVGDIGGDALVVKFKTNGDVSWAKSYEEFATNTQLIRMLKTADGNWLLFGISSFIIGMYESGGFALLKMDNNGNIIWTKHFGRYYSPQITDVSALPDNGFVVVVNDAVGSGPTYSYVIRYDANANIIWQKELSHFVAAPIYRSITCSSAVFLAYDSYDYYDFNKFGVDKLDLATGNQLWSKRFETPNDNVQRINRIYQVNDTAYLFVNNQTPINPFMSILNTTMLSLDRNGNINQSLSLQGDAMVPVNFGSWWDESPPTVTLTPDLDFVLTNRVAIGSDTALNLSRFRRDGTKLWSHNFPGMKSYTPLNIHPQGNGFLIMGTAGLSGFPYRNSFLLKVDSSGNVVQNATGNCGQTDRPFTASHADIKFASSVIDSVVNLKGLVSANGNMLKQNIDLDATELCSIQKNCGTVLFKQKGLGCSLQDTLVYYLQDAVNCDAAATWQYDASYFRSGEINGDSIELLPLRTGSSTIIARIEGNCFLTEQHITTAVLVPAAGLYLGPDTSLCDGGNISLHAGPVYAAYKWNDNSTDSVLTVKKPGNYFVTVTDNCGGTAGDTINVLSSNASFALTKDTVSCNGDLVALTAGKGYSNYRWLPAYHLQAVANAAVVSPDTTTRYFVSAEKGNCTITDSVLVTVLYSPPIHLQNDTSICSGDSLPLDAGKSFVRYLWNNGVTSRYLSVKEKGYYSVSGTYTNGCMSKDTFLLTNLYDKPSVHLDKDPMICIGNGKKLQLSAQPPDVRYQWSDGSNETSFLVRDTGRYWVTVTNSYGCKSSDTVTLTDYILPPANFLPNDTTICQYERLTLSLSSYSSYLWSDHSTGSSFTITQPGLYSLQVMDMHTCVGNDSIRVTAKQCNQGIYLPTAFTPNNDGLNDVFKPLLYDNVTSYEFAIYDRFGRKLFETQTPLAGWDGNIKSAPAEVGAYVWICQYKILGERMHFEKGTVTLIR